MHISSAKIPLNPQALLHDLNFFLGTAKALPIMLPLCPTFPLRSSYAALFATCRLVNIMMSGNLNVLKFPCLICSTLVDNFIWKLPNINFNTIKSFIHKKNGIGRPVGELKDDDKCTWKFPWALAPGNFLGHWQLNSGVS